MEEEREPALKSTQALHLPEKEREEEQAAAVVYGVSAWVSNEDLAGAAALPL